MSTIRARTAPPASAAGRAAAPGEPRAPEVIVVTLDDDLENALRAASPVPMRVATSPAALADLLMSGRAGALVLDIGALDAAALTVARHLAEQFPEVPLVAVGYREDEARLAGLISRGLVYRFLHRPVSAARARNFIDAALRRAGEFDSGARPSPSRTPAAASDRTPAHHRSLLALVVAGAAVALALGIWLAARAPAAAPAAATSAVRPAAPRAAERAPVATEAAASSAAPLVAASLPRAPVARVAAATAGTRPVAEPLPATDPTPAPAATAATAPEAVASADAPVAGDPPTTTATAAPPLPEAPQSAEAPDTANAAQASVAAPPGPAEAPASREPAGADAAPTADRPPTGG